MAGTIARRAAGVAAVIHLGAVVGLLVLGAVSHGGLTPDPLGPLPIAAVYGLPAVIALAALRGRAPLLLAAGTATVILAVFPFSLHSFVLGPVGIVYVIAYGRSPSRKSGGARAAVVVLGFPLLLVAGFLVAILHDDPACWTRHRSGEVTVDRDPAEPFGSGTLGPGTEVVEHGCTSDTVVWWEATASLGLSAAAIVLALRLVPRDDRLDVEHGAPDVPPAGGDEDQDPRGR